MRISTLSSLLCALAVGAICLTGRADNTPAPTTPAQGDAKAKQAKPEKPAHPAPKPVLPPRLAYPGADLGLKPIPAPPLPISASKADRLADLLGKYQANQLSPEAYHQQRAAILAQP